MGLEIERKFILRHLPDLSGYKKLKITQHYLKIDKFEERVRETLEDGKYSYEFTTKTGHGISRKEVNRSITKNEYNDYIKKSLGGISKTRYVHPFENDWVKEVVIDIYDDKDATFDILEIEYKTQYIDFIPHFIHTFIKKEVTGNKEYSNRKIALINKQKD